MPRSASVSVSASGWFQASASQVTGCRWGPTATIAASSALPGKPVPSDPAPGKASRPKQSQETELRRSVIS